VKHGVSLYLKGGNLMKRIFYVVTSSLVTALFLFMPSRVVGEDIEIRFEADIYAIDTQILQPCLGKDFSIGDILKGTYIYGTDTDDTNPEDNYAHYDYDITPYGIQVTIGAQTMRTDPENVEVRLGIYDGYTGGSVASDTYFVDSVHNLPLETGGNAEVLYIYLYDDGGNAIDSVELPMTAPVLSDWNMKIFQAVISCYPDSPSGQVLAHITSMERVYPMDDLVDALTALLEVSPLGNKQSGLLGKLAGATAKFDRGKDLQACHQLNAFIRQFAGLLPMFEEPYEDDAEDVLEQAENIFDSRCADEKFMQYPMGE